MRRWSVRRSLLFVAIAGLVVYSGALTILFFVLFD